MINNPLKAYDAEGSNVEYPRQLRIVKAPVLEPFNVNS